jgi:hypothetical protein
MNPTLCENSRANNCLKCGTTKNTLPFDSKILEGILELISMLEPVALQVFVQVN